MSTSSHADNLERCPKCGAGTPAYRASADIEAHIREQDAEITKLRAENTELKAWKADQQQALIAMATKVWLAGFKGDGLVEGVKWLANENARLKGSCKPRYSDAP
jgi:hypothetical protein